MNRADGKVCIVTGAAQGLGAADARLLVAEGAQVVLTDVNAAAGEALAADLGPRAHFVEQDVAEEESWPALVDEVMRTHGRLDVLVNNAGIAPIGTVETTNTAMWRRTLAIHLDGTFFGCHYALPAMRDSGGGSIINMSSTAALVGIPPYFAYSAAKGGIRALSKSVAIHCKQTGNGIRCNSVHPGSIATPMVQGAMHDLMGVDDLTEEKRVQFGVGEPMDVAFMVLYLASDEAKHVNGAELVVDNGDTVV